jgi:hypothetical protein
MERGMIPDDKLDDYESGPYCEHWGDPRYCDKLCSCSHLCRQHSYYIGYCTVDCCHCRNFKGGKE